MSVFAVVLLVAALVLLAASELPRLAGGNSRSRGRAPAWPRRGPRRRNRHLRVVKDEESDEFARSVERDLANLPTYDPRAKRD
jgi:hypothetical protein